MLMAPPNLRCTDGFHRGVSSSRAISSSEPESVVSAAFHGQLPRKGSLSIQLMGGQRLGRRSFLRIRHCPDIAQIPIEMPSITASEPRLVFRKRTIRAPGGRASDSAIAIARRFVDSGPEISRTARLTELPVGIDHFRVFELQHGPPRGRRMVTPVSALSARFHDLVSGRAAGIGPSFLRLGLSAASVPYAWAVNVRNRWYDRGWLAARRGRCQSLASAT